MTAILALTFLVGPLLMLGAWLTLPLALIYGVYVWLEC